MHSCSVWRRLFQKIIKNIVHQKRGPADGSQPLTPYPKSQRLLLLQRRRGSIDTNIMPVKENNKIYIIVGKGFLPYWTDRKLARLVEWTIGKKRTTIVSDSEYEHLKRKEEKRPVIVLGGPDSNIIAKEIGDMYPHPAYAHKGGQNDSFFIHGGVRKNEEGYEVFDPCILIYGRRIRDTIKAIKYILVGDGKPILIQFINCDWQLLPKTKESKWKIKYWDIKETPEPVVNINETIADKYIKAVMKLKKMNPSPADLQSVAVEVDWNKHFGDYLFLQTLKDDVANLSGQSRIKPDKLKLVVSGLNKKIKDITKAKEVVPQKEEWLLTIKDAAIKVREIYDEDSMSPQRQYKSLKDASNQFFAKHEFVKYPDKKFNKNKFYENVKKSEGIKVKKSESEVKEREKRGVMIG